MNTSLTNRILFYPANIVTYIRILFILLFALFAFSHPILAFTFVLLSESMDPLDGYVAKITRKSSHYGSILDMTTDRTSCLIAGTVLAVLYPHWCLLFLFIMVIDIASHLIVIYTCAINNTMSHKSLFANTHISLLKFYYSSQRYFMFTLALGYDLSLGLIYLYHFYPNRTIIILFYMTLPIGLLKFYIHLIQSKEALKQIL